MSTQLAQTTILPPTFPANNKPIGPIYGSVFGILDLSYMEDHRHSRAMSTVHNAISNYILPIFNCFDDIFLLIWQW